MSVQNLSVLIVAAEESSCKYALRIIKKLSERSFENTSINFYGIGNQELEEHGLRRLARSEDVAVMGLFEIFKVRKKIKKAMRDLVSEVDNNPPQVALLLDFGGFNLYLAKELKKRKIPVVYYILPKAWAWRKKRALKIKENVTEALAIHPFEENFFADLGVSVRFIGHPLLEERQDFLDLNFDKKTFKKSLGLNDAPVLGLMPGSRTSEIQRHLPIMLDAAEKIHGNHKEIQVTVLVAPGFDLYKLKAEFLTKSYSFKLSFIKDNSWKMVDVCDFVLTTSGTATLQVALLGKPQVVLYKMNYLTAKLAKFFVNVKYFSLVNLILNKPTVTELFQEDVTAKNLANEISALMLDESHQKSMLKDYESLEAKMQTKNATNQVTKVLEDYLQKNIKKHASHEK